MDETSFHELIATEDRWRGRQIYRDFMDSMKATGGTIFWGKKKKLFCRLHAEEATPSIFSAITVAEVAFSCMHIRFCLSVFVVATIMKVIDGALYAVRWHGSVTSRASHAAHSNFVPLFSFFLFFFFLSVHHSAISRRSQQTALDGRKCSEPPPDGALYYSFVSFIFTLLSRQLERRFVRGGRAVP